MKPTDLRMGDFVILGDGSIYQIQQNKHAEKTGLSLFNHNYYCLIHLDSYDDDFNCKSQKLFTIHKIIQLEYNRDDYKLVGQHFVSGNKFPKTLMNDIHWDWERIEADDITLQLGDTATAICKTKEIKIGLNTFDRLEYCCWGLILTYAEAFDIRIKTEDDIDFYAAKEVQESILKLFKDAGFTFIHEEE